MIQFVATKVLIFVLVLISKLPKSVLIFFHSTIYFFIYRIFSYRLDVVKLNLSLAFSNKSSLELSIIERKFYHHFTNLIIQHIQSINYSSTDLEKRIWLHHQAKLDLINAEKSDKNIFVVTSHFGNWEYAVLLTALSSKLTTYGIYKPIHNQSFDFFIKNNRERFGLKLINTNDVKSIVNKNQQQNNIYCFIADQTPVNINSAYKTKFLGIDNTPFYKGFATLAHQLDAIIFYASILPLDDEHYEIKFTTITENANQMNADDIVEACAQQLENDIRLKPEFWLWTHKRWKRAGFLYK